MRNRSMFPIELKPTRARESIKRIEQGLRTILPRDLFSKVSFDVTIKHYPPKYLYDCLAKKIIEIDPYMQRMYVWSHDIASKFIESIMYGMPIPPIIVEVRDSKWIVLDGVQRLLTIKYFYEGKLRLDYVVSEELRGRTYNTLPEELRQRFDYRCQVPVMEVKVNSMSNYYRVLAVFEIFRRLNLGSVRLTPAQVLFCSVDTELIKVVKDIASKKRDLLESIFQFKDDELRKFLHYEAILHMFAVLYYYDKKPIVRRYIIDPDIMNLIFLTDKTVVNELRKTTLAMLELFKKLRFKREDFLPSTYKLTASSRISRYIICILTYALRPLLDELASHELSEETLAKLSEEIRSILRSTLNGNRVIEGQTLKQLYKEFADRGTIRGQKVIIKVANELKDSIENIVRKFI